MSSSISSNISLKTKKPLSKIVKIMNYNLNWLLTNFKDYLISSVITEYLSFQKYVSVIGRTEGL